MVRLSGKANNGPSSKENLNLLQRSQVAELVPDRLPKPRDTFEGGCLITVTVSLHYSLSGGPDPHPDDGGGSFAAGRARKSLSLTGRLHNSS